MIASTGLFFEPLEKEFGWSRALLSSGASVASLLTAALSPFFGALIDRFGSRRVVLPGLILTIISIASFSQVNGSQTQWLILWVIFGIVAVSIKSTAWTAAVLGVFNQSRGLALGLVLSGTAVAQAAVPPLTNWLITTQGWRATYGWLGFGWGGITFILCLFFLFDAVDRAGAKAKKTEELKPEAVPNQLEGLTRQEALRDVALWKIGISNFVVMALTMGLTIHLFSILTEAGVSRVNAAWLTSLGGIAGIFGKLVTGYLLDRFRPNWIGGVTLGAAAFAFLLLMEGIRSPTLIVAALIVNGYAAGTKTQITGFLTAQYGGMRSFGVIYGMMAALMALAAGVGPTLAGIIYDRFGGYSPFLAMGVVGCLLCGGLMISLPAYPAWRRQSTKADGID